MIYTDHPLFEQIRLEHKQILALLDRKPIHVDSRTDWYRKLFKLAEKTHHEKEEILFFSKVHENPKMCEGGPLCTYFFDPFVNESPIKWVEKNLYSPVPIERWQTSFYEVKSPITIPVDEHRVGRFIILHLLKNNSLLSQSESDHLIDFYIELQTKHINKEENCLFHNVGRFMDVNQANQIYAQWILNS